MNCGNSWCTWCWKDGGSPHFVKTFQTWLVLTTTQTASPRRSHATLKCSDQREGSKPGVRQNRATIETPLQNTNGEPPGPKPQKFPITASRLPTSRNALLPLTPRPWSLQGTRAVNGRRHRPRSTTPNQFRGRNQPTTQVNLKARPPQSTTQPSAGHTPHTCPQRSPATHRKKKKKKVFGRKK